MLGPDDFKIAAVTGTFAAPVIAQAVSAGRDLSAALMGMKELGSVVAVIYLFYWVLTRALPQMQERYDKTYRELATAHTVQLAEERKIAREELAEERRRSNQLQDLIFERMLPSKSGK